LILEKFQPSGPYCFTLCLVPQGVKSATELDELPVSVKFHIAIRGSCYVVVDDNRSQDCSLRAKIPLALIIKPVNSARVHTIPSFQPIMPTEPPLQQRPLSSCSIVLSWFVVAVC